MGYDNISTRLPVPVRDDQHIPGLSARVNSGVVLMWGIFAGFLLHFFHCNFRDVLLAPVYAPQIDTLQDIIDKGFILLFILELNSLSTFSKIHLIH